jgi:sugar phosphate isomerase/epimerase
MRLGLLTAPFPETPLADVVDWTVANGFESIEIACWPPSAGSTRRYAGTSHIDVTNLSPGQATDLRAEIEASGLTISGLGYYPNPLHPDPAHREMVIGHLRQVISAAEKMDVELVNTFIGADAAKTADQNWTTRSRSGRTSSPSPRITAARSPSRTARCCSATTSGRADTTWRPRRGCGAGSSSSGAARSGSTSTRRT